MNQYNNMGDLIRKSAVIEVLKECNLDEQLFEKDVFDKINDIDAIEAVPVAHAKWIPYFEDVEIYNSGGFKERKQTGWICGKCKTKRSFVSCCKNFCGNCGADMREGDAE